MRRIKGSKVYEYSPREWGKTKAERKNPTKGLTGIDVGQKSDWGLSANSTPSDYLYGSPSGTSYPGKPDVDMKFKGWVAMFGEHFLCECGCKRFADKSLDKVLRVIEKEIRHFYEGKQIKKKGKSGVEVKSYTRKPRKKKEDEMDEVDKEQALIVDDKSIKLKPKKTKIEKDSVAIANGVEVDDAGQWKKKGEFMYPVRTGDKKMIDKQKRRRKARYEEGIFDDVVDEKK